MLAMADVAARRRPVGADGADRDPRPPALRDHRRAARPRRASRRCCSPAATRARRAPRSCDALGARPRRRSRSAPTPCSRTTSPFATSRSTVIDEQHRFGVSERRRLQDKGEARPPAGHVGDADPAHPGADRLRRPRRLAAGREAARPHAGRHPRRAHAAPRRGGRAAARGGRGGRPGVLDLPAGRASPSSADLAAAEKRAVAAARGARRRRSGWSTASCRGRRRTR